MFLNESSFRGIKSTPANRADGDIATGINIMLEAEQNWNEMTMQMIRLEHTAIVNNNRRLLSEGGKEYLNKVKQWFKDLYAKIKNFIAQAIANILEFIANLEKVKKSFPESNEVGVAISKLKGSDRKIKTYKNFNDMIEGLKKVPEEFGKYNIDANNPEETLILLKRLEELTSEEIKKKDEKGEIDFTPGIYKNAKEYLYGNYRKKAIRTLKDFEKKAKNTADAGIRAANDQLKNIDKPTSDDRKAKKNNVSDFKKMLTYVQRFTVFTARCVNNASIESFKVMNKGKSVVKKSDKKAKKDKKKKNQKSDALNAPLTGDGKQLESYSLLDQFSL